MDEPRGFNLREVHEYQVDPISGVRRLIATHPYVRLRRVPEEPPVYLCEGVCWSETGEKIDPHPKWLAGQLKTLTPAARAAVGFEPPAGPPDAA